MERPTIHPSGRPMNWTEIDAGAPMFERFYKSGERVEITWKPGKGGDYRGYGARTEGRKQRGYIGRTTGWAPSWLLVLTTRSWGGDLIKPADVAEIRGIGKFRR